MDTDEENNMNMADKVEESSSFGCLWATLLAAAATLFLGCCKCADKISDWLCK